MPGNLGIVASGYNAPTGAAPTFVASYSDGANSSSHVLNVPTGTVDGDIMIAAVGQAVTMTLTPPGGWTLIQSFTGGPSLAVYYRIASSEPASYTWTTAANSRAVVATYRGASAVDVSSINNGSSATPTASSITTTAANTRLVFCVRIDGVTTFTPPGSYTLRQQSPTSGSFPNGLWDDTQAAAGATGSVVFTAGASSTWAAALVALKP